MIIPCFKSSILLNSLLKTSFFFDFLVNTRDSLGDTKLSGFEKLSKLVEVSFSGIGINSSSRIFFSSSITILSGDEASNCSRIGSSGSTPTSFKS